MNGFEGEYEDRGKCPVYLVEGEADCWLGTQAGLHCFAFTCGAKTIPDGAVDAINAAGITDVRVVYDNDDAGRDGAAKVSDTFTTAGISHTVLDLSNHVTIGGDLTTLFNDLGRDDGKFRDAMAALPTLDITTPSHPLVQSLDAFLADEDASAQAAEWLVRPGLVARASVSILAGAPKSGKSTMVLHAGLAVAGGYGFLGQSTERCRVLFVNLEMSRQLARWKLRQIGGDTGDPNFFVVHGTRRELGIDVLRQIVEEYDIGLIILDSLYRWWQVEEESSATATEAALDGLISLARDTGVAELIIHHPPKHTTPGAPVLHQFRGSGAIAAACDIGLILKKVARGNVRKLEAESRFDETPDELFVELRDGTYHVVDAPTDTEREHQRQQILDKLPGTVNNLKMRTGLSDKSVRDRLKELDEKGQVRSPRKEGKAMWWECIPKLHVVDA